VTSRDFLTIVTTMRDLMSAGSPMPWPDAVPVDMLEHVVHLPPPSPGSDGASSSASWRRRYRYGLFYFRNGPDYITVRDMRKPDERAMFTLDDPHMVAVFRRCMRPVRAEQLDNAEHDLLAELVQEDLVLNHDDSYLTLPYHLNRWPIPYDAI
jgi:hypothetical protein